MILVVMIVENRNKSFFTISDGYWLGDIQVQNGWAGRCKHAEAR